MRVGIASNQPKPTSQPESRLFVRKAKSQCSNTPEKEAMIYSCAVPVTSARNNEQRRRGQLRVDVALSQDDI